PASRTALSDEEVTMKPQSGVIYHMRYELVDAPGTFLEIATTRPETIMGDTGVAVHPEDERYQHLIGKKIWRPFPREAIPIVADTAVDREFGTGVLKVTPAHDVTDWEIGERTGLPAIDVMNPDGTINEKGGEFAGMDRFEARKAAAKKLEELGLLVERKPYENNVGFSERANVPIEPRLSEQWFLKYPKIDEAIRAVENGHIKIYPERWTKTYLHWLKNIKDWCLSRQLWWGHRIPVWYRKGADRANPENYHVSVAGPSDPENWEQEEDVLDTWASSWLWPLATLGWPDASAMKARGFESFFPSSVLVTGFDILFFWVARMIISSLEFAGPEKETLSEEEIAQRVPFRDVYITGLIRDIKGRKMSKSLGNFPDALELLDKYGADGVRFGLVSIAPQGQDIRFDEERLEPARNFCNKLWNVARFRQMQGDTQDNSSRGILLERIDSARFDLDDHAILGSLASTLEAYEKDMVRYEVSSATSHIYSFFWSDFCDWYIEVSKTKLKDESLRANCLAIQDFILRELLLLLHPFMPFITEELFSLMGYATEGDFAQNHATMNPNGLRERFSLDGQAVSQVALIREFVTKVRALKAEYKLAAKRDVSLSFTADSEHLGLIESNRDKLLSLVGAVELVHIDSAPDGMPGAISALATAFIDLSQSIDVEAERARLSKEEAKLQKAVKAGRSKLSNEKFLNSAPPKIVEGARAQLAESEAKLDEVLRLLKSL
ncbi:MAG: valine--tRNA ligase, partial [Verrucomicrobiota bacterium]